MSDLSLAQNHALDLARTLMVPVTLFEVDADVVFLRAGRTPKDLVFRDELAVSATRLKGFRLYFLPDLRDRTVMCCGPAPFMKAARSISAELSVPAERYIEESFDAAVIK